MRKILCTAYMFMCAYCCVGQNILPPFMLQFADTTANDTTRFGRFLVSDTTGAATWNYDMKLSDGRLLIASDTLATTNQLPTNFDDADSDPQNELQVIDLLSVVNNKLRISLSSDMQAFQEVALPVAENNNEAVPVTPNCPDNVNPVVPNILRVGIGAIELASGDGNPTGQYQASTGSWFFDSNGYAYRKFGSGIDEWICVLDGNTTFDGGGASDGVITDVELVGDSLVFSGQNGGFFGKVSINQEIEFEEGTANGGSYSSSLDLSEFFAATSTEINKNLEIYRSTVRIYHPTQYTISGNDIIAEILDFDNEKISITKKR